MIRILKTYYLKILFSILFFLSPFLIYAQEQDFALWSGLQIRKDITQKLRASFEEEIRFNENITNINTFYSDIGISYKLNK